MKCYRWLHNFVFRILFSLKLSVLTAPGKCLRSSVLSFLSEQVQLATPVPLNSTGRCREREVLKPPTVYYLTSLCLCSLTCEMGVVMVPALGGCLWRLNEFAQRQHRSRAWHFRNVCRTLLVVLFGMGHAQYESPGGAEFRSGLTAPSCVLASPCLCCTVCLSPFGESFPHFSLLHPQLTWAALFYAFVGSCTCPVVELVCFIVIVCLAGFLPFDLQAARRQKPSLS